MQMVNESNAPAPLSMAVVPQSFLNGLMDEVREVKSLLQKKSEEEVNSQWIESTQVRKRQPPRPPISNIDPETKIANHLE